MKNFSLLPFLAAIIMPLGGCNSADTLENEEPTRKVVDAAQMKAAQTLSIGSTRAIEDDLGPYILALRCNIALGEINDRFLNNGGFSDNQKQLMRQMRNRYRRQAEKIGTEQNKSSQQIRQDLEEQASKIPDSTIRAQIAIGCLRNVAQDN
ncbi:hypothetical protein [Qipengyuania sp. 483]